MSSLTDTTASATPTSEQKGLFFYLIKKNAPPWILAASGALRRELYDSLIESHRTRSTAGALLNKLRSPEQFCSPLLAKAMSDKLSMPLDVSGVVFQHVRATSSLLGLRKKLVLPINRDLLAAACENFESRETEAKNYSDTSLIYIPQKLNAGVASILPIQPHDFAQLCRTLDLGKQYQTHLESVFELNVESSNVLSQCAAHVRSCFDVDRHIALMKKHISTSVHQMLKAVKDGDSTIKLGKNTLGYQSLEMFNMTLHGPLFIGPVSEHADDDYRCVVYLPGDPLHPLKEYASFTDFEVELSGRLKNPAFKKFFMGFLKLGERAAFQQELNIRLYPGGSSLLTGTGTYVTLTGVDIEGDPFTGIHRQQVTRTLADARLLVVPTDDEDEKTRLARLETFKEIGIDLLLVAASFLPGVGEVLLTVGTLQLLSHVYEGIASWTRGEQEQATDHLFDVIENIILMAAFAAGTKVVGAAYKTVRSSAFIERLIVVNPGGGRLRLWKPDLKAFRQHRRLPKGLPVDERGLRWLEGQAYVTLDSVRYAVHQQPETELWEVLPPPGAAESYRPLLETNDRGAWRHDSERVQEWGRLTLFRRFGYTREAIPDAMATRVLAVSGLDDSVLRQVHIDQVQTPALLVDTVQRFMADAAVKAFIEQLQTPSTAALADPDLQLHVLTAAAKWPSDSAISVVNALDYPVNRYGSQTAKSVIRLTEDALHKGQLHRSLLSKLSRNQRESLLGNASTNTEVQAQELARIVAEQAQTARPDLFRRVYQRSQVPGHPRVAVLMQHFPELPASAAEELVNNAFSGEWRELDAKRVPLRLAEEARRYQQMIRVCRAYEGLYLDGVGGQYTNRLVLDALKHLPGWSDAAFVQILEWTATHDSAAAIGPATASERTVVSVFEDRINVIQGTDAPLVTFTRRTREHYFRALWTGLSAQRRTALGVQAENGAAALQEKITRVAQERRTIFAQSVGARLGELSPMGLAERTAVVSGATSGEVTNVMVRRALELYPMHTPAQIHRLLNALDTNEIKVLMKLEALRLEFFALRETLSRWVSRQTWHLSADGTRQPTPRDSKLRAMRAIIRSWRKEPGNVAADQSLYGTLRFAPEPLGELPPVVADFSHVGRVIMDGVMPHAGLNEFLRNFSQLRSLSLSDNQLSQLPESLERIRWLTHLDLSNNRLQSSDTSLAQLGRMKDLRVLHLDFNPNLAQLPDLGGLAHLEQLTVRGSRMTYWPQRLSGLLRLQLLDLRDNRIETLPARAFDTTQLPQMIRLHGNPLSSETLKNIATYQQTFSGRFGVTAMEGRKSPLQTVAREDQSVQWLAGESASVASSRREVWEALRALPDSADFFQVLLQLVHTAEFTHVYPHLRQRVWDVVDAAAGDQRLRRSLFNAARSARVSVDGYSALFSEMEVLVLCFRASAAASAGVQALEAQLVSLLKGLFRLHEVESLALADISARFHTAPMDYDQALQVSLAYRVGLAQRLNLPAQPQTLSKPLNIEVSPTVLDQAFQQVLKTESSGALRDWSVAQTFWVEYLESAHGDRFSAVNEQTSREMAQLEGQIELTREAASTQMNAILDNFGNQRRELIGQLTDQALARHAELDAAKAATAEMMEA